MSNDEEYHSDEEPESPSDNHPRKRNDFKEWLLAPLACLWLFWDIVTTPLRTTSAMILDVLGWVYLPVFNPKAIFLWKSPITFMPAKDLQFKYWFMLFFLCYMTFYRFFLGWYIQRGINHIREVCYCDLIRVSSSSPLIEGTWFVLFTSHKREQVLYFLRKFICEFFKLL